MAGLWHVGLLLSCNMEFGRMGACTSCLPKLPKLPRLPRLPKLPKLSVGCGWCR